jgi:DNA-binding XRE family transcriptional regulator
MFDETIAKIKLAAVPAGIVWALTAAWLLLWPPDQLPRGVVAWSLILATIFGPPLALPFAAIRGFRLAERRRREAWQDLRRDRMDSAGETYTLTPAQCRAARDDLGWSQDDLAWRADVSTMTLAQFENGHTRFSWIAPDLRAALEIGGADLNRLPPPPPLEPGDDSVDGRVLETEV